MKSFQDIREQSNKKLEKVRNLMRWVGSLAIPDTLQKQIIFVLLLGSGVSVALKTNQTFRSHAISVSNHTLSNSIHYIDKGATLWGKAIGKSLNYVHPNLSEEVKNNISLYAPILSALIIQPISLTFNLFSTLLAQQNMKQQQKVGELLNSIKVLYERGMTALKSTELDSFHNAACNFRQARHLFKTLSQADSLLSFKLTDIYYNEALAFFSMRCYSEPKRKYALEVINELLTIDPDYIEAINLRGIIYLSSDDHEKATIDFQQSLQLDNTQTDIHIFLNYCQKKYTKAVIYSFAHLDKKLTWQNNSIHILLYCHGFSYYELHKAPNFNNDYKKNMLAKAISSFESAEIAIPKNPSFENDRIKILKAALETLITLIRLLSDNELISVKRLFEKPTQKNEAVHNQSNNTEENNNEASVEHKKMRTKNDLISLAVKYVNHIQKINPAEDIKDIKELASIAQKANIKEPDSMRYTATNLI